MIDELHVKNVALIREAVLAPARGMTVITGETGAGKTALLSALKLLVGARADASLVREGADAAQVEGRLFSYAGGCDAIDDAEGLVVARTVSADGRSRVHVHGAIGSVGQLAASVGATVDLCGQHEHQKLLSVANHRAMLDAWAGEGARAAAEEYVRCWKATCAAAEELKAAQHAGKLGAEALEQARYTLRRIDEVNPQEGEWEDLQTRVPLLENAESLAAGTHGAHEALAGEGGALMGLGMAAQLLDAQAGVDAALGDLAASLREVTYIVEDVARECGRYADAVEYDPAQLAQLQARMGELHDLMRTWGPTINDVLAARNTAAEAVAAVDGADERVAAAQAALEAAETELTAAAEALHKAHVAAAPGFATAVTAQMARLELADAALVCSPELLPREKWSAAGPDHIEFLFRPGAQLAARPLSRIASGGEVSRVMLAIKVVLGAADDVETLVFDEVDAGVGGSAARSLAAVLADLAKTHQVIVVTHLAQVAVCGQAHYVVRKTGGEAPETQLLLVTGEDRTQEVARMLSGDTTAEALAHARQLLVEAANGQ